MYALMSQNLTEIGPQYLINDNLIDHLINCIKICIQDKNQQGWMEQRRRRLVPTESCVSFLFSFILKYGWE